MAQFDEDIEFQDAHDGVGMDDDPDAGGIEYVVFGEDDEEYIVVDGILYRLVGDDDEEAGTLEYVASAKDARYVEEDGKTYIRIELDDSDGGGDGSGSTVDASVLDKNEVFDMSQDEDKEYELLEDGMGEYILSDGKVYRLMEGVREEGMLLEDMPSDREYIFAYGSVYVYPTEDPI